MENARPIAATERSGVLVPANLARFRAEWLPRSDRVRDAVDTYWRAAWDLDPDQALQQRILEFPAVTLSIESGAVPAPLVVTAVQRRAWSRAITGSGDVFAIRLRPAGLAVVSDLLPARLGPVAALTPDVDARAHRLLHQVAAGSTPQERVALADAAIADLLQERPPSPDLLLANAAVDALAARIRTRTGRSLAAELGVSERSIQRALRATLGMGPKAVARRIRLQEVVRLLSGPEPDVAAVAARLGYADQSHLINDFRGVAGSTPGRYVEELRAHTGT